MFDTLTRIGASAAGAYEIKRSLRFNSADSANLSYTPGSDGNKQKFTFSLWHKKTYGTDPTGSKVLFSAYAGIGGAGNYGTDRITIMQSGSIQVEFYNQSTGGHQGEWRSAQYIKDVSGWYHIVVAIDSTQSTQANRMKLYVNNTQVTSWDVDSSSSFSQNASMYGWNNSGHIHHIGSYAYQENSTGSSYLDGYITDFYFIDDQQLTPSSFGETDEDTGQWVPKKYSGTYNSNCYFLNFSDNSNTTAATLGKDSSGQSNNWTPNNFSVSAGVGNDSFEDTPTNNFPTINTAVGQDGRSGATAVNGALDLAGTDESTNRATFVFGPGNITSGKWYWEVTSTGGANGQRTGLSGDLWGSQGGNGVWFRGGDVSWCAANTYKKYTETMETSDGTYSSGDVIGVAYSADDDEVKYYRNGSLTLTDDTLPSVATTELQPVIHASNTGSNGWPVASINFGQRAFAYTPPTGYKKLCSKNLPDPTIKNPTDHFFVKLYEGDGTSSHAVTGVGFQPGMVWIKNRDASDWFNMYDSVRGPGNRMSPSPAAGHAGHIQDINNQFGSFDSDGFTLASSDGNVNTNNESYVAWCFNVPTAFSNDASVTGVGDFDTSGKINQTAGFGILTYVIPDTSDGQTGAHGMGVQGQIQIQKDRESTADWGTQFTIYDGSWDYAWFSQSDAKGDTSQYLTSTTFKDGHGASYVGNDAMSWIFSEVAGFSRFGSYRGNGNSNGPYVHTGFKPAMVIIKRVVGGTGNWNVFDNKRPGYNVTNDRLFTNYISAELDGSSSGTQMDLYSNGFKLTGSNVDGNGSGDRYIYLAFAESPFKYANAR